MFISVVKVLTKYQFKVSELVSIARGKRMEANGIRWKTCMMLIADAIILGTVPYSVLHSV